RDGVEEPVDADLLRVLNADPQRQLSPRIEAPDVLAALPQPPGEPVAAPGINAGHDPDDRRRQVPVADLLLPFHPIVGREGSRVDHRAVAPAPLDPVFAHIDNHVQGHHVGASSRTCASSSATAPTSCDSPCPVTADTASTGRRSSPSSRRRTSSLPVNSALLMATISGLAASAGLYSSSSRRMVR